MRIIINSGGTIEDDGLGLLQVDFANKHVGGGVLGVFTRKLDSQFSQSYWLVDCALKY